MKHRLRPQISVNLLPGIIRAAIVKVKSVIAVWTPWVVVSRSSAMLVMATFMLEPAKLAMNWVNANGKTMEEMTAARVPRPSRVAGCLPFGGGFWPDRRADWPFFAIGAHLNDVGGPGPTASVRHWLGSWV